jgi:hypothetical protein
MTRITVVGVAMTEPQRDRATEFALKVNVVTAMFLIFADGDTGDPAHIRAFRAD